MINAIKYMDELEQTGFTQDQAKTAVNLWLELMNENLATKNELKDLETSTRHEFKIINEKIETLATKNELKQLEMSIRHEFVLVRSEMKDLGKDLTIKLGSMMAIALSLMALIQKFG